MSARKVPPYHLVQLGELQEIFNHEAAKFLHIMTNGGGLKNMGLGETLTNLQFTFLRIAALLDASRNINGQVTLDTGNHALALVRAMRQQTEEEQAEQADGA